MLASHAWADTCSEYHIDGLRRTSEHWLKRYLSLDEPIVASEQNLEFMRKKLLTTEVFQSVAVSIEKLPQDDCRVFIQVVEKWTLIPVVRATVGGGTPMLVAGVYDTHSFGSLWTLGGEFRKYGDAKPGHVVWARAPRWGRGRKVLSIEYWNMFRERAAQFDENLVATHKAATDNRMLRLFHMVPLLDPFEREGTGIPLLAGIDARIRRDSPPLIEEVHVGGDDRSTDVSFETSDAPASLSVLPTLQWDSISINALRLDGAKVLAQYGVINRGKSRYNKFDLDVFHYHSLPANFGTAIHAVYGKTSSANFNDRYFLGGFDSVRGFPDGIISGTECAYANFEIRNNFASQTFANWEAAAFYDVGFVRDADVISSYGVGLRMAVPQVNRLLLRMDYARSVDGKTSGANIGLNQFFQPHRPL